MPDERKLYSSRAEGELYVVPAASLAEANTVMDADVKQNQMLSHTPCELIPSDEVDGLTFWRVPE
jgi:hypothetical protein